MPTPLPPDLDKAHGFCFWARQSDLVFGKFRAVPVSSRPVVSVARRGQWLTVLPATTQHRSAFFHLVPGDCFAHRPAESHRDSYLCPRYETLPPPAVAALQEIGVLSQALRVRLWQWLQGKPEGTP
jgi:hypothetical protein